MLIGLLVFLFVVVGLEFVDDLCDDLFDMVLSVGVVDVLKWCKVLVDVWVSLFGCFVFVFVGLVVVDEWVVL